MHAVLLERGRSRPRLRTLPAPRRRRNQLLLRTLEVGIDGTDEEIVRSHAPQFPPRARHLVLGHEALAEVVEGPGMRPGTLVVPLVRHGCGKCPECRARGIDYCSSGDYTEHGIRGRDGFMRDLWTDTADRLVRVPPRLRRLAVLTEPLSIVLKARDEAARFMERLPWVRDGGFERRDCLVMGTGSLGSLAAFLLRAEGANVWCADRHDETTAAARLMRRIGARHVDTRASSWQEENRFDIILDTTGAPALIRRAHDMLAANGALVLLGIGRSNHDGFRMAPVWRRMVLRNEIVFGSVNSGRRHYRQALRLLGRIESRWSGAIHDLITQRFSPNEFADAFAASGPDVVKKVFEWSVAESSAPV